MHKGRLEAFSDGVMAIIITIMVLELKVPHGETLGALWPLWPVFLSYLLSFAYVGTYWTNHHHLMQAARRVTSPVLMANLNLLFWLSLLPFTTGWMGENHFAQEPVALYGANLLASALSYYILQGQVVAAHGKDTRFRLALGSDLKGKGSIIAYGVGIAISVMGLPLLGFSIFCAVALVWLVPDRRMETAMAASGDKSE
ncbi:MAG: TMEM175 family protein [Rhizobiaceae bacterium]